jgi:Homeodomain-like domain
MIPEAREVRLSRKDRKVLEERCRSPVTLQRDLKRARIVLLAAAGRSTRSIAKEVGVQPRIVSLWRHRYADHGLEGLQSKPLPGKQPIYTKATEKRILKLLDKSPPAGYARWLCWLGNLAMSTCNMSGGSCAATRSIWRLASPGARATTQAGGFLKAGVRNLPVDDAGVSKSPMHKPVYERFARGPVLVYDAVRDYRPDNMRVHVDFKHYFGVGKPEEPQCIADNIELKWENAGRPGSL